MGFGFELFMSEDRVFFHLGNRFIPLPIKPWRELRDICESWGFSYAERALHLHWGTKPGSNRWEGKSRTKLIWMPWDFGGAVRWEVLREDGSLAPVIHEYASKDDFTYPWRDGRKMYQAEYTYTLKNGEQQKRIATFHVSEMEWRWRIFHRLPFRFGPKILQRSINVHFNDEVGERTGSWKGGCTGCSYVMLPNESALDCLRRMERERKFD